MSRTSPSACPDLVVLYPGAGLLNVFAYRIGFRLKALLWHEQVKCSANVDLVGQLPPLLARHPMRLETETALVANPSIGGFLLVPGQSRARRDQAWVERQLELALPYPPQELHWRTRAASAQVELFWLPKAWVKSQSEALSRLGLRLNEIYPRASLFRTEAGQSVAQPCLLREADALHVFSGGLVQRSAPLPAETEAAAQAQQLEQLALGTNSAGVVHKTPSESEETLAQRILSVWLDGSEPVALPVGRWAGWPSGASWQPALTLSVACAVLVAIAAIGLNLQNAAMENNLEALAREQRKLAPVEQKFMEMNRSIRNDRKYVAAARVLDDSTLPLAALNRISAALPNKYWVQHMQVKGDTLDLAGRGGGNDEVIRLLEKKGIAAAALASENASGSAGKTDTDVFSIRLDLNRLSRGGAQ